MERIEIPISFGGGLNSREPNGSLQPNQAHDLSNWVPSEAELRPRLPFSKFSTTTLPTTIYCRGIVTNFSSPDERVIMALTDTDATPDWTLWDIQKFDITSDAWTQIAGPFTLSDNSYDRVPLAFAVGDGKLIYSNPAFPSTGRARYWDGSVDTQIATDRTAGRAHAFHLNRWWTTGALDNPHHVKFTEIGDITNWNTSENFFPVGDADWPGLDLLVYDRGMLIGKGEGIWWLGGSTRDSFQLLPISRVGVGQGRSMCASPYGVFILNSDGLLCLWDGGEVEPIGDQFEPGPSSAGGTTISAQVSLAWARDRLYVCRQDHDFMYVFKPDTGAWSAETIHNGGRQYAYVAAEGVELYVGAEGEAKTDWPGGVRDDRWNALAVGLDQSQDGGFLYIGAAELPGSPLRKATLTSVYVQYFQSQNLSGDGAGEPLSVTAYDINAVAAPQTQTCGQKGQGTVNVERLDFGMPTSGYGWTLEFAASPTAAEGTVYHIQRAVAIVTVDDQRARR